MLKTVKVIKNPCRNCPKAAENGRCDDCKELEKYETFLLNAKMRNKNRKIAVPVFVAVRQRKEPDA